MTETDPWLVWEWGVRPDGEEWWVPVIGPDGEHLSFSSPEEARRALQDLKAGGEVGPFVTMPFPCEDE